MHTQFQPHDPQPLLPNVEPWEAATYAEMQADETEFFVEETSRQIGPAVHHGTLRKVGLWLYSHHCIGYVNGAIANRRLGLLALAIQAWSDWFATTGHSHSQKDRSETAKIVAVVVRALFYISPEGVRRGMGNDD